MKNDKNFKMKIRNVSLGPTVIEISLNWWTKMTKTKN